MEKPGLKLHVILQTGERNVYTGVSSVVSNTGVGTPTGGRTMNLRGREMIKGEGNKKEKHFATKKTFIMSFL